MFGWLRRIIDERREQQEAARVAEELAREKRLKDEVDAVEAARRRASERVWVTQRNRILARKEEEAAWREARERATVHAPQPANRYRTSSNDSPITDALAWSMMSSSLSSPASSACSPASSDSSSSSASSSSCSSSSASSSGGDSGGSSGGGD